MSEKRNNDNEIFKELINKQLRNIPLDKKLQYNDLRRICKYINSSLFDEHKCVLWSGYVTNENNSLKGTYINFYFRKKKSALHRLLYINFVDVLEEDEYIKFNCENKGKCCNIYHLKKYKYQKRNIEEIEEKNIVKKKTINILNREDTLTEKLHITFD